MGRFECPQCGRGFGSIAEVLDHTQAVHAGEDPGPPPDLGLGPAGTGAPTPTPGELPGSGAPSPSPRPTPGEPGGPGAPTPAPGEPGGKPEQKQRPALGTVIALLVVAGIILLNLLGGGAE